MNKNIQGLRGIFAILIVLHHSINVRVFGSCSVSFFFMLSGFALAMGYWDKVDRENFNYTSFIKKRMWKVYPLHSATLLAIALLSILALNTNALLCDIPNILLLQSWIPIQSVYFSGNAVSWYLSDLVFFYLLSPFAIKFIKLAYLRLLLGTLIALLLVMVAVWTFTPEDMVHPIVYINPLPRLFDFLIGITGYKIYRQIETHKVSVSKLKISIFEISIIAIYASLLYAFYSIPERYSFTSMWLLPNIIAILLFTYFNNRGGIYKPHFQQVMSDIRKGKL